VSWGCVDSFRGRYYVAPRSGFTTAGADVDGCAYLMSENRPPDPLARLGEEIDKARAERVRRQPAIGDRSSMQQGLGLGVRIGIELVVAIVVSTGLGWAIDRWFGTRPWGMIVLFFLGVAAGMLNVYRAVTGVRGPVGYRPPAASPAAPKGQWDDEDC
jgi:ATP synthase protein I